jgi:glucokinase
MDNGGARDMSHSTLRAGLDLGGTKIQAVVVDAEHRVVGSAREATPSSGGPEAVLGELAAALAEAARQASVEPRLLAGIGVGSPGLVDRDAGTVAEARNLPQWNGAVPLAAELERRAGARVRLGNDVGVALDAEARLGAGRTHRSFVGAFWGTGVGGGVVLDGKRWLGRGFAGEIGHMVVKRRGARCPCGREGCLEAYAGRAAMEREARERAARGAKTRLFEIMERKDKDRLTSGVWARALQEEDPLAVELVERAVRALGAGLASAVNLLDVDAVVIGGGLGTRLGPPSSWDAVAKIRTAMEPHMFAASRPPAVVPAELGDLAGAIGASLLALE